MNDEIDTSEAKNLTLGTHPELIELEYVARKYNVSIERAKDLVAQFGDDDSLIAAELALKNS